MKGGGVKSKGSRDFSQGLNRAWPPEILRRFFFFFPLPCSSSRSRAGTWPLPARVSSRKKSGKSNIAKGAKMARMRVKRGEGGDKKKNERLRERGASIGREEIRARVEGMHSPQCTFTYRFYLVGARGPFPYPSLGVHSAGGIGEGKKQG